MRLFTYTRYTRYYRYTKIPDITLDSRYYITENLKQIFSSPISTTKKKTPKKISNLLKNSLKVFPKISLQLVCCVQMYMPSKDIRL